MTQKSEGRGESQRPEIQLPHLETFSLAAERGSFTAAGKELDLTQAAVSQRIHALEQAIGKSLFDRHGTRILLTEAGRQLYEYAQRIAALHHDAFEAMTGRATLVSGELLLAASTIPGEQLLPGILAGFGKQYPKIRVRATILDSLAVLDEVEQGHVQIGLVGQRRATSNLEFQPFAADELVVVAPANHAWKGLASVPLQELKAQPLVLREPGSGTRWCFEQGLSTVGSTLGDFNVVLELGSNESIKEAVLKGIGVTILSSLAVQKDIADGRLHALTIAGVPLTRALYAAWDTRRVLSPPARVFRQFLESSEAVAAH
jgi:DNA-binding transcriptional LysR family regulator